MDDEAKFILLTRSTPCRTNVTEEKPKTHIKLFYNKSQSRLDYIPSKFNVSDKTIGDWRVSKIEI